MPGLLVLWDIDHTLIDSGGAGVYGYQLAFRDLFGRDLPGLVPFAGRTERAIALDLLALAGIPEPRQHVDEFLARIGAHAPELAGLVAARGRAQPGAAAALAAVAAQTTPTAVQSVLTGNVRAMAEMKLRALGLTDHLDLDVGAYGDTAECRADLVRMARSKAAIAYRHDFAGSETVLAGDTPLDVAAALSAGARSLGVATGASTAAELAAAGADAVLPDLADPSAVVAAILGRAPPST
jgi:phosphoglycolate phosphatase-like HAD superfamily hydrolase